MHMVNITLAIPEDLKKELQKHEEVNWSAVIRLALQDHLRKLRIADAIARKSKLTVNDAGKIARMIKKEMAKEHGIE